MKFGKLQFLTVIAVFGLLLTTNVQVSNAAVVYPYSVNIGDKIDYHVDTLVNGSNTKNINIFGLKLSQDDNFQLEIFAGKAQSSNYIGTDYTVKFVKGTNESIAFSGASLLYTSNSTFWESYKNTSQDIGSQVYQLTRINNSITYSWTLNADNFNKISFSANDGLVTSYERATTTGPYNYTHFKFTKGTGDFLSNIPGFGGQSVVFSIFAIATTFLIRRKTKN